MPSKHLESHFAQYACAARALAETLTADTYEEVLFGLASRETLGEQRGTVRRLRALDTAFAEALRHTSAQWWLEVTKISLRAGFAQSAWWQTILRLAAEEPAEFQHAVRH